MDLPTPDAVMVVTSAGTLVAAVIAGVFAAKAAHWTKRQSEHAERQVETGREALALAQGEAEAARRDTAVQREESARAARRAEEVRADALAPSVYASVRPRPAMRPDGGNSSLEWRIGEDSRWYQLHEPVEFRRGDARALRQQLMITLQNVSGVPARVDFMPDGGILSRGFEHLKGSLYVLPGESALVVWSRPVSAWDVVDGENVLQPDAYMFRVRLWVSDLGSNVRDEYAFSGYAMRATVDGSRVTVEPATLDDLGDPVAVWVQREYERLDAAEHANADSTGPEAMG